MKKNIIINKLFVVTIVFVISAMISGCATTLPDKDYLSLTCPVCKKENVHILEIADESNIRCKTCGSKISPGEVHRCPNCGARIKDFSVTLPF